jgi:Carboxypeptidase regulatory-like domain/Stage II sporulation protein
MSVSSLPRWLAALCALGTLALGGAAAASTAAPAGPHDITAKQATTTAATSFTGQVRDGRPLEHSRAPKIVIPDGLTRVGHAAVSLRGPGLSLRTSTDAAGTFAFRNLNVSVKASYTLTVRKAGFGRWTETGITLVPGQSSQVFVALRTRPQTSSDQRVPQPDNGATRSRAQATTTGGCGHNSSGWDSQTEQPATIRVYDPSSGTVSTYDFNFYIEHVIPVEWGYTAPNGDSIDLAAYEAASVVIRSYAWYFINNGSKGSSGGDPCSFDVDDTPAYQVFSPSAVTNDTMVAGVYDTASYLYTHDSQIWETGYCANINTSNYCGSGAPYDGCGTNADPGQDDSIGSQNGFDVCGQDGDSWQQILSIYYDYGLQIYGSRSPAVATDSSGNIYAFWENTGGGLEEAYYSASAGSWSGPSAITVDGNGMGPLGSPPTVAVGPQTSGGYHYQYVFWKGTGSTSDLYEAYWNGSWHGPVNLGDGPLGSAPTAGADSSGNVYVYWESPGSQLYEVYYNGSAWDTPNEIKVNGNGMGPLGSSPSVAVTPGGSQYVFWKSPGNALYYTYYDGAWHSQQEIANTAPLDSPPTAGADGSGDVYVFWENTGGGLEEVHASDPASPSSFGNPNAITVGGSGLGPFGSAPTVGVNASSDDQYVFWRGVGSGADLWEAYWNGSWNGPVNRGDGPLG